MCKISRILQSLLKLAIHKDIEKREVSNILISNLEIFTVLENRSVLIYKVVGSYI